MSGTDTRGRYLFYGPPARTFPEGHDSNSSSLGVAPWEVGRTSTMSSPDVCATPPTGPGVSTAVVLGTLSTADKSVQ